MTRKLYKIPGLNLETGARWCRARRRRVAKHVGSAYGALDPVTPDAGDFESGPGYHPSSTFLVLVLQALRRELMVLAFTHITLCV